jgi:hypothetical protein
MSATSSVDLTKAMTYKDLMVTGLRIAHREAGKPANPKLMLLYPKRRLLRRCCANHIPARPTRNNWIAASRTTLPRACRTILTPDLNEY